MLTQLAVQEEAYQGMFVASEDWVTAVTYVKISQSVYGTVFLSIGLATAVVFVFTGRPLLTLLATGTVLMTNLSLLGLMYTWGWTLGAIEGMAITSLVGLSVDFCIHICEGYVHSRAPDRFGMAMCAPALTCSISSPRWLSMIISTHQ